MILFEKDWASYPGAIIDDTTNNPHFINFANILRGIGVRHYYLHLALINPTLKGVDPFDPKLTEQQKADIIAECYINPWYYFRECIRLNDGDYFELSRGNFAMIWSFFNSIDAAVEFLRQHGKTTAIVCLESWLLRFTKKTRTIHITRGPDVRSETINKLKEVRNALPDYLWKAHRDDPDNQVNFGYTPRGTKLICAIGQNNEISANGVGRGLTAARLFCDEGPFTSNIQHMLPAALAAGSTDRLRNHRRGVPYGNVFATTAGDLATAEGAYIYGLFTSGITWDERYLDIPTRGELVNLIDRKANGEDPRTLFYIKFNHRQLGTTDDELIKMIRNAGGTREKKLKDFGGVWATGGLNKPYSEDDAIRMAESRATPAYKEIFKEGYIVDWFYDRADIDRKMRVKHVIGIDPSDAVGRDAIGLVMINSETGEVAAVCKVKESNIAVYISWLAVFMKKYTETVLVVERRSQGTSILDGLLHILEDDPTLHKRIYNKVTQEDSSSANFREYHRGPHGNRSIYWAKYRKTTGFATDGEKRRMLYGQVFSSAMGLAAHSIRSPDLIDEIMGLVERNQRIDHIKSGHDDLVISWLLAMWLVLLAKNINVYGLNNKKLILSNGQVNQGVEHEEMVELAERVEREKSEIEKLSVEINRAKCPVERMGLLSRMRYLVDNLEQVEERVLTLDGLRNISRKSRMGQWF